MPTPAASVENAAEILRRSPLFALLDDEEIGALIAVLDARTIPAGEKVFSYGEPGDWLCIVARGAIELFVRDTAGTKIVLNVCDPPDIFGELSVFDGGARTATAEALEDSTLLVLGRDDLAAFLMAQPSAALDLLTTMGKRIRHTDELLRKRVARNINEEMELHSTLIQRVADTIAEFTGSIPFLAINAIWFLGWIVWNMLPGVAKFDPYPFGFLTMVVSLEAIFLSIFVLVSQNRQSEKDRLRADADYEVNLKSELEIAHLHEKVDFLTEEVLARLKATEKKKLGE